MKLSELIEGVVWHDRVDGGNTTESVADAITARLHECVKPLEWRLSGVGYTAVSMIVGDYFVAPSVYGPHWYWQSPDDLAIDHVSPSRKCADGEAAKAAAQAHYAAQIIAGLDL